MSSNSEGKFIDPSNDSFLNDDNGNVPPNNDGDSGKLHEGYKKISDLTADEIRGLEFDSENAAWEFYCSYARCHGFSVRKDDVYRDSKNNIVMRQLVCSRQGLRNKKHLLRNDRRREAKPITRTNCQARLRERSVKKVVKSSVAFNIILICCINGLP